MSRALSTSYRLLSVLQDYAPNGQAQEVCSQMYNKAIDDAASKEELDSMLATMLSDGLNHGNWPWVRGTGNAENSSVLA